MGGYAKQLGSAEVPVERCCCFGPKARDKVIGPRDQDQMWYIVAERESMLNKVRYRVSTRVAVMGGVWLYWMGK